MKNKLTKKQIEQLNNLSYDAYEFAGKMLSKIEKKTKEGVRGWEKMLVSELLDKAWSRIGVSHEDKKQILDATNYLFFAWIKAGKP